MSNKFNYKVATHPAKPRNERRQSAGEGSSSGSTIIVGGVSSAGDGHIHANKTALDAISIDGSNYLKLTQKPDGASESVTAKVKAGYADKAAMADYATQAGNADMWDNLDAADYLDQPVRTTDEVAFKKVTSPTIESPNWQEGPLGGGFKVAIDANGHSAAIFDKLEVRQEARFNTLTVEELRSICGAIIVSAANAIVTNVSNLGSAYRSYYKPKSGEQMWRVGDQARCQRFTSDGLKYYWRLVTSVSDTANAQGEHWINLSATTADGSGVPSMDDEVVLLGHRGTDNSRKNAIIISSGSFDNVTPYVYSYKNITDFSLDGKRNIKIDDEPEFKCKRFVIADDDGNEYQVPRDCGQWSAGAYAYYDRVSHLGSLWLCIAPNGTSVEPSDADSDIWLKEVQKGDAGAAGNRMVQVFKWSKDKPAKPSGNEHSGWYRDSVRGSALTTSDGKVLTANGKALMVAYPDDYRLWGCQGEFSGQTNALIDDWVDVYQMSGDDGKDGRDGKDYEYIFACTIDEVKPDTPATVQQDDYIPSGWTDDAQGVTAALRFEWSCKRVKIAGVWGDFSRPALWARFSEDGAKGDKGDDGKDVDPVLADQKKFEAIEAFFGGAVDRETIESLMNGTSAPFEVKNGIVGMRDAFVKNLAAMNAFIENLTARQIDTRARNAQGNPSGKGIEINKGDAIITVYDKNNKEVIRIDDFDGARDPRIDMFGDYSDVHLTNRYISVDDRVNLLSTRLSDSKLEFRDNRGEAINVYEIGLFQMRLPSNATIDMPCVALVGYGVAANGRVAYNFGCKSRGTEGVYKPAGTRGKYYIQHDIGHTSYTIAVNLKALNNTWFGIWKEVADERTATSCTIYIASLASELVDLDFDITFFGKN